MIQKKIVDYLLSIAFVLNLAVGMISNYSTNIFLVKAVTSLLLLLLIFFDIRVNKIDSVKLLKENNPKRLLIILVLFIAYLSLTLTYSSDPQYGFQKILNFLLSAIPSVFAFYYLVITFDEKRLQVFINSLVMFTIVTVLYIVIDYPFEQGTLYEFRPERWSHVIYGRIIGCIAVVLLLYILSNFNQPRTVHYGLRTIFLVMATSLAVYGLYLSALRSAFLGLLIVGGGVLVYLVTSVLFRVRSPSSFVLSQKNKLKMIAGMMLTIMLTLIMIITIPKPEIIGARFDNLTQVDDLKFGGDEPINSRVEALRLSKEIVLSNPIFGIGFGGFKAHNEFTEFIKYPHNIFVEMAVEGGVIGLLVLGSLFLVIFKSVYRYVPYCLPLITYCLLLAFFSKDIPSQTVLWIFVAFAGCIRRNSLDKSVE